MVVIGVTESGRALTIDGYVLAATSVEQWHEHFQHAKIDGHPVRPVTVAVAALSPSFPIEQWAKGKTPNSAASDALRRAHDAAAVVVAELQHELAVRDEFSGATSPAEQATATAEHFQRTDEDGPDSTA